MTVPEPITFRYAPSRRMAVAVATGAVIAAIAAAVADATTGRLLLICAAAVLAAIAITDIAFTPRLVATGAGVSVFAPSVRAKLRWDEIDSVRVDEHSRHGLANRTLEIEAGDRLIVLSRRSLGADPREVYEQLVQLRSAGQR